MEYLKSLFDRPSPEYLYHYTNGNSFLGIIQKTEMWASHIRFMNDLKEEVYALELLERRLPDLLKTTSLNPNKMIKLIQKYFDEENSKLGIFVLSFSENSDDLNQWRGYANVIPSYCIKFDVKKIKEIPEFETKVENVKILIDASWNLNEYKSKFFSTVKIPGFRIKTPWAAMRASLDKHRHTYAGCGSKVIFNQSSITHTLLPPLSFNHVSLAWLLLVVFLY